MWFLKRLKIQKYRTRCPLSVTPVVLPEDRPGVIQLKMEALASCPTVGEGQMAGGRQTETYRHDLCGKFIGGR